MPPAAHAAVQRRVAVGGRAPVRVGAELEGEAQIVGSPVLGRAAQRRRCDADGVLAARHQRRQQLRPVLVDHPHRQLLEPRHATPPAGRQRCLDHLRMPPLDALVHDRPPQGRLQRRVGASLHHRDRQPHLARPRRPPRRVVVAVGPYPCAQVQQQLRRLVVAAGHGLGEQRQGVGGPRLGRRVHAKLDQLLHDLQLSVAKRGGRQLDGVEAGGLQLVQQRRVPVRRVEDHRPQQDQRLQVRSQRHQLLQSVSIAEHRRRDRPQPPVRARPGQRRPEGHPVLVHRLLERAVGGPMGQPSSQQQVQHLRVNLEAGGRLVPVDLGVGQARLQRQQPAQLRGRQQRPGQLPHPPVRGGPREELRPGQLAPTHRPGELPLQAHGVGPGLQQEVHAALAPALGRQGQRRHRHHLGVLLPGPRPQPAGNHRRRAAGGQQQGQPLPAKAHVALRDGAGGVGRCALLQRPLEGGAAHRATGQRRAEVVVGVTRSGERRQAGDGEYEQQSEGAGHASPGQASGSRCSPGRSSLRRDPGSLARYPRSVPPAAGAARHRGLPWTAFARCRCSRSSPC